MAPPSATVEAVDDTTSVTMPDPLTLEGVEARRAKFPKLKAGTAAPSDVEIFKGQVHHAHKPAAKRWDRE